MNTGVSTTERGYVNPPSADDFDHPWVMLLGQLRLVLSNLTDHRVGRLPLRSDDGGEELPRRAAAVV
jgi:hypothetical protein